MALKEGAMYVMVTPEDIIFTHLLEHHSKNSGPLHALAFCEAETQEDDLSGVYDCDRSDTLF